MKSVNSVFVNGGKRVVNVQYCEKVMQTNFDEIRSFWGSSRKFRLKRNLLNNLRYFAVFSSIVLIRVNFRAIVCGVQ